MAIPCKPLARAAAIMSSGLEIPSPEKKECVCRSILNATGTRLVWSGLNGKRRFYARSTELHELDCLCSLTVQLQIKAIAPAVKQALPQECPARPRFLPGHG